MVERSTYDRGKLKQRLYAAGIKARRCELCGLGEVWRDRHISLILDHINGVADDHRIENLRILCPNCAATLDTHCGRNLRREPRVCELCHAGFQPNSSRQRYCSPTCRATAPRRSRSQSRPARRKVPRPPYEQLLAEVKADGFSATGRRHGVSDNAIRKWLLQYRREMPPATSSTEPGS